MPRAVWYWRGLRFGFAFQHFATTVKAVRADVVAQVGFASRGLNRNARNVQGIVRAVHTAFGRRFLVLLDGHDGLLKKERAAAAAATKKRGG